jgi:hypothetical protein
VLAARLPPVDRRRTGVGAPFFARTWEPSTHALDQSSLPTAFSSASRTRCNWSKTPACCHRSRRRQQVCPEPNPSSKGSSCQAMSLAARTGCPAGTAGPAPAAGQEPSRARAAATARPAPTGHRPRSTAWYSHRPERPNRHTGHGRPGPFIKIVLSALTELRGTVNRSVHPP